MSLSLHKQGKQDGKRKPNTHSKVKELLTTQIKVGHFNFRIDPPIDKYVLLLGLCKLAIGI